MNPVLWLIAGIWVIQFICGVLIGRLWKPKLPSLPARPAVRGWFRKIGATFREWCAENKKLAGTIAGGLIALVPTRFLDPERKKWVVEIVMLYVAGQAVADHGKEAVKEQGKIDLQKIEAAVSPSTYDNKDSL
jgi:hypothetical protein